MAVARGGWDVVRRDLGPLHGLEVEFVEVICSLDAIVPTEDIDAAVVSNSSVKATLARCLSLSRNGAPAPGLVLHAFLFWMLAFFHLKLKAFLNVTKSC
jgi:hypothetical protein